MKSYSESEIQILNFSILELVILQTLFQLKRKIKRYKLLKIVHNSIGESEVSISKFYRILSKLEKSDLVARSTKEDSDYFITVKGVDLLTQSKSMLSQIGLQTTSFFENDVQNIVKFSRYESGKVLFVDCPELFDVDLLEIVFSNFDEMNILASDEIYSWISNAIEGIKQTRIEEGIIKEPDNSFQLIVLFYPGINGNPILYNELKRVLQNNKPILILDSTNPIEKIDHFAVEILLKQFWRIDYWKKKSIDIITHELEQIFTNGMIANQNIKGLELQLYIKE